MKFQGSKPVEMRWPNRGFLLNSTCHRINSFLMRYMGTVKKTAGAFLSFHFLLFILVISSENSVATDTLTRSQGITVEQTLISAGQIFQLGFFSPGYSGKQYVGIWYKNISGQKPIWVANKEDPLTVADTGSSLTIGNDGNLMLLDGMKKTVWSTNVSSPSNGTIAVLSDKGDLSLKDNVSGLILWESFTYPGDTFIAGMTLGANKRTGEKHVLSSWQKDDDPLPGDFVMGLTTETPPQAFIWRTSKPYWRSGPWDGWKFIGLYSTEKGYSNGLIVTQDNLQGSVDLTYNAHSQSYVTQIVLTPEGNLKMSHWHIKNSTGGVTWEAIQVPCDVYGTCGPFGVCDRFRSKTCQCLKGFVPKSKEEWSKSNWTGGCVRQTELFCRKNTSTLASDKAKTDEFRKLSAMKLPDHYEYFFNEDALGCQQWCLSNCSCVAYAYVDGIGCMVWASDLLDVQQFLSTGADLFLRLAYSELGGNKKMIELIIIITAVPGAIFLVAFLYGLSKWIANRRETRRHQIKGVDFADRVDTPIGSPRGNMQGHCIIQTKSSDLPMFDFNSLAVATNNFSETNKLGAGGFGPVYKGKLEDGQEIAVKRLSNHSGQGDVEFKNEILLISKLQHRNLVRLLGYCIEGDEMLLIYEYLKNKSLDTFLFDAKKRLQLDWNKRFNIIEGIARGLLYLHRDSCLRIIHRDLKASNILLDDNMNPKISDFGIARAFQITQELANTCRIVGTFGYMSPEYAIGGLFSEKSDVFSFGVLLLEIISGTKITGSSYQEECLNLQEHAWHLWKEGRGLDLMDMELSDSCSQTDFMKCMQIGLLCVQDHPERPTMSVVVLMLTSDRDIPQPKQPTLYKGLRNLDLQLRLNNVLSRNDTSLSMVEGHG